jgi:hypothetical protein
MVVERTQREKLLRKVSRLVEDKYFNPEFDVQKWRHLVDTRAPKILDGGSAEDFEQRMHDVVSQLG